MTTPRALVTLGAPWCAHGVGRGLCGASEGFRLPKGLAGPRRGVPLSLLCRPDADELIEKTDRQPSTAHHTLGTAFTTSSPHSSQR